jgi:hypothetical protein
LLDGVVGGHGRARDGGAQLPLDLLVDGLEELLFRGEVVVQRPARQPGPLDDVLAAGGREAALGEQGATRGDERGPGQGSPLGLGPAVTGVTLDGGLRSCDTCRQPAR